MHIYTYADVYVVACMHEYDFIVLHAIIGRTAAVLQIQ